MMSKPITYLAILLLYLAFLLYNYYPQAEVGQAAQPESGRLLLWHSWTEAETVVLKGVLAKFNEIYPNIRVISAAIAPDDLLERYQNTARQGLGPDILIGESAWIRELVDAELITDIAPLLSDTDAYLPNALESLRDAKPLDEDEDEDETASLYALPLSLEPVALYYNTELVSTPATTLDELLEHAQNGQGVALNTTFDGAFWGIQAFGGQLFDEQGGLLLDQGGFANWLEWLKHAQNVPGMILSRDELTLRQLFSAREVAYYVAPPQTLPILQEALGKSAVGVAPLPAGVHGASGPFLRVEALMFNPASSKRQRELSLLLAKFLTNAEQSRTFMRDLGRVPANQGVRVHPEAYPLIDGFVRQARTALPIPNWPQMALLRQLGDESYTQVLQGVTEPAQATYDLTALVNESYPDAAGEQSEERCLHAGELRIWHSWTGESLRGLAQISQTFMQRCPEVTVLLESFTEDELTALFNAPPAPSHPMLIIAPSRRLFELAEAKLISPITPYIGLHVRQRFLPVATQALNYQQEVMGLPLALDFSVLYYKSEEVTAAATLDELLAQSTAGQEVALLTTFESAYWGISAFGGQLFDEEYRLLLEQGGLIEWLTWLEEAQKGGGVHLSLDQAALETSFVNNKNITTYIGPTSALNDLQSRLGDSLGVAPLPSSAVSDAHPMLNVDAFFFPALDNPPAEMALAFATFATGAESQTLLMQEVQRIPATVNISTSDNPVLKLLLLQAKKVLVPPLIPQMRAVWQQGDTIYSSLQVGEQTPSEIGCQFSQTVNEINGFGLDSEPLPSDCLLESEK